MHGLPATVIIKRCLIPGGVPEGTVRTVTKNRRTLKFESFGFEEE